MLDGVRARWCRPRLPQSIPDSRFPLPALPSPPPLPSQRKPAQGTDNRHGERDRGPDYLGLDRVLLPEPDGEQRAREKHDREQEKPDRPASRPRQD